MGVDWTVIAHEFGHGIGGFADEYSVAGTYTGGEQSWIDLTTITNRATTKWKQFINPTTPLPTGVGSGANYNQGTRPATWSSNLDVGLFEGGGTMNTGIYRPVENCRMKGNTPEYCPVCYTSIKTNRDMKPAITSVAHTLAISSTAAVAMYFFITGRRSNCSVTTAQDSRTPSAVSNVCRVRGNSNPMIKSWSAISMVTASKKSSSSMALTG